VRPVPGATFVTNDGPGDPRPSVLPAEDYAYLLGVYLGDGHLVRFPREVFKLTIACDAAYPGLIDAIERAIQAVLPSNRVGRIHHPVDRCTRVQCYSKLMPLLFPQHGRGRKHERPIHLVPWQAEITARHPRELVRGLIHSDGSRFVARQRVGARPTGTSATGSRTDPTTSSGSCATTSSSSESAGRGRMAN
jgi:hypothetical protein